MISEFRGIKVTSLTPIPEDKLRELHDFAVETTGSGISWCFRPHNTEPNKPTWLLLQFEMIESYPEKKDLPENQPGQGIKTIEKFFEEFGAKAEYFRSSVNTSPVYVSHLRFIEPKLGATVNNNLDKEQIENISNSLSVEFGLSVHSYAVSSDPEKPGTIIFTERHNHQMPSVELSVVESMLQDQFEISAKYNDRWMDKQTQKPVVGNWNVHVMPPRPKVL